LEYKKNTSQEGDPLTTREEASPTFRQGIEFRVGEARSVEGRIFCFGNQEGSALIICKDRAGMEVNGSNFLRWCKKGRVGGG